MLDSPTSSRTDRMVWQHAGVWWKMYEYSEKEVKSSYCTETKSDGFEALIPPFSSTRFRLKLDLDEDYELLGQLRKEKITMPTGMEVPLLGGYMDGIAVFDFTMNWKV